MSISGQFSHPQFNPDNYYIKTTRDPDSAFTFTGVLEANPTSKAQRIWLEIKIWFSSLTSTPTTYAKGLQAMTQHVKIVVGDWNEASEKLKKGDSFVEKITAENFSGIIGSRIETPVASDDMPAWEIKAFFINHFIQSILNDNK